MYVYKQVVKIPLTQRSELNISPFKKETGRPHLNRSNPFSLSKFDEEAESHEIDNLQLLYELEYKNEKLDGNISKSLQQYDLVNLTEADEETITRSRQLIEVGIRKQIKKELSILQTNEIKKMRLQGSFEQIKQSIVDTKARVDDLKQQINQIQIILRTATDENEQVKQVQVHLEAATQRKAILLDKYRVSQSKVFQSKEYLSMVNSDIFAYEQQLQQQRLNERSYKTNSELLKEYKDLGNYKQRLQSSHKKQINLRRMYEDRVNEIGEIGRNTTKLDQTLKEIMQQIHVQKHFIRATEQQQYTMRYSDSENDQVTQPRQDNREQLIRHSMMQQYEDLYLPYLNQKWSRVKPRLSEQIAGKHRRRLKTEQGVSDIKLRKHLRKYNTKMFNESLDYDQRNGFEQQRSRHPFRSLQRRDPIPNTWADSQRSEHSRDKNKNTVRLALRPKRSKQPPSRGHKELEELYRNNNDKLKNRITSHIKNKQLFANNRSQRIQSSKPSRGRPMQKLYEESEQVELVSVGQSQNDSNCEYVEVEMSKAQLQQLDRRKRRGKK